MAKQNQAKQEGAIQDNIILSEVPNENNLVTEQNQNNLGDTNSEDLKIQDKDNPYANAATANVEEIPIIQPSIQDNPNSNMQTSTVEEPIKPVLSDQLIHQDFSQASTVNVHNEQGVTVKLSGTAAKILKSLDAKTKIVE
ncbi:hypothetical protein N6B72_05120 [Chryseobacterium soli]|uniref:hypothetical protein n=1 Tax=Chryseobacterium soli TaxID=445961 RepID=UPI00295459E7|nr:hypothetical protein [Chryseobacterium soli]MDV7696296.1 hypothetical protein [Chryseobacterium soli]